MTHDLHMVGKALYGERWKRYLAHDLGVNERTVRHWAAGSYTGAIPWDDIAALCRKRGNALVRIADELAS